MSTQSMAFLNQSGRKVRDHYLTAFLLLLCRYECLPMHAIAYGLFPTRAKSAALAAAQRVVGNAYNKRYVTRRRGDDERRYFALNTKGAQFLNERDTDFVAHPTTSALKKSNKEHRTAAALIAMASEHRGMHGFSESLIAGSMHTDITVYFGHTPDAITLFEDVAVWHEVEMSRRSTTRQGVAPDKLSGSEKLVHLVRTLRTKRYLVHGENAYQLMLVMHCTTAKIEREVRALVWRAIAGFGGQATAEGFEISFESSTDNQLPDDMPEGGELYEPYAAEAGGSLRVVINRIDKSEEPWAAALPWPGCEVVARSALDAFVQRRSRGEP